MDLSEIIEDIESSEVVCLHFPYLRKTLIADMREEPDSPRLLQIVPMARSIEDRFRSIRRLRPTLKQPDKVTIVPWARYVDSLKSLGVWEKLAGRYTDVQDPEIEEYVNKVFQELLELEAKEFAAAIMGNQYQTIWEASD